MKDLTPFLKQLLSQVNKLHYPWVHADDIDKWPKGLFDKLLEMKVLRPSSKISTICECPACHDETAEPYWMEYPDGRKVPVWYCQSDPIETDRIEINPKWLRMWDIVAENIPKYLEPQEEPVTKVPVQDRPAADTETPELESDLPPRYERAYQSYVYAESLNGKKPSITATWLIEKQVRPGNFNNKSDFEKKRILSAYLKKWSHVAAIALCKDLRIDFPYHGLEVIIHLSHGSVREFLRLMYEVWDTAHLNKKDVSLNTSVSPQKQSIAILKASEKSFDAIGQKAASALSEDVTIQKIVSRLGNLFDSLQALPHVLTIPETASLKVNQDELTHDKDLSEALRLGILTNAFVVLERDNDILIGLHPILAPKFRICYRNPFYYPERINRLQLKAIFFSKESVTKPIFDQILATRLDRYEKAVARHFHKKQSKEQQLILFEEV